MLENTESERWQFWVDRGGTFTDLIGVGPAGESVIRKILSHNPQRYEDPIAFGIHSLLKEGKNARVASEIRVGTTMATNALLERKGEPCVLLTTRGFRDVLRIGWQTRPDLFALNINLPEMLYAHVCEIDERILADGQIETEPDSHLVLQQLEACRALGFRSCAVVFMNAWKNPVHERKVGQLAKKAGFEWVSMSTQVSPQIRFVNRGDTTLADAYLHPLLSHYGEKLSAWFPGVPVKFMQSQGGLAEAGDFRGRDAILSGPAGGLVGAAKITAVKGIDRVICLDMGGTSTDVAIYEGSFDLTWERVISGIRLQQPMLKIDTVAAGGGSKIKIHQNRLMVGPESAGADPGPACYGQGGPLTITDCNVYLGRIQESLFPKTLGPQGNTGLDRSVIEDRLLEMLQEWPNEMRTVGDPNRLCEYFLKVAVENISRSIRNLTVHKGKNPADYGICCYGGAGGQLVCDIAENLGVKEVLIHPLSGVLSALGMGMASASRVFELSVQQPLSTLTAEILTSLKKSLEAEAITWFSRLSQKGENLLSRYDLVLSYEGCDAKLIRTLGDFEESAQSLKEPFHQDHKLQFGYLKPDGVIWVHSLNLTAESEHMATVPFHSEASDLISEAIVDKASVYMDGNRLNVPVFRQKDLSEQNSYEGPFLVQFNESTLCVRPGWSMEVCKDSSLRLRDMTAKSQKSDSHQSLVLDPLNLELFNHYFMSVAEQMGEVLAKTAMSVNIRERLDFSCALFDRHGALISNAPHVPVHLGSMSESIRSLIEFRAGQFKRGESWFMNCPFHGGTHLPDITVVTPVFDEQSSSGPYCFVASRGHHGDIGGIAPGSMPSLSCNCDEEGILIPWTLMTSNGSFLEDEILALLNSGSWPARNPGANVSDLKAQLAANHKGSQEIQAMVSRRGYDMVTSYMEYIQTNGEQLIRSLIPSLKEGRAEVTSDQGFLIKVHLIPDHETRTLGIDFSGTSPQGNHNFNAPFAICKAAVLYVLRCLVGESMPLNDGCLRPVSIHCPKGTMLNPEYPAAVVAGNVETSSLLVDLLFSALAIKACSQGTMNNLSFGQSRYQYYETLCGGEGASGVGSGCSAVHTHMTNSRLTDPEVLESRFPVVLEEFSVRSGSGGAGKFRGGDGVLRRIRFLDQMDVNILSGNRIRTPSGLFGGQPGMSGKNKLMLKGQKDEQLLSGVCQIRVNPGDRIQIETPGGGGYFEALSE